MTEDHPPYAGTPYVEPRTGPAIPKPNNPFAQIEARLIRIEQRIDVMMNYLDPMPTGKNAHRPEDI
jgi:hypothetical protein